MCSSMMIRSIARQDLLRAPLIGFLVTEMVFLKIGFAALDAASYLHY